ncbi:MAG: hypothetical protein K6A89_04600 [Treponema sp.]|nr:hypothetical protein [Treponema sp.]
MKGKISFTFSFLFLAFSLFAEDLPNGYKNIKLGMSLQETKDELVKNSEFGYRGERDVSLLPSANKELIETDSSTGLGSNFLERCWFQFFDDELYIITINMNKERIDYYSIFTTLCNKYGEPVKISPDGATWKNDKVTMSLEKPLTLKYIDNSTYDKTQNYSNVELSATEITQQMFLDEL